MFKPRRLLLLSICHAHPHMWRLILTRPRDKALVDRDYPQCCRTDAHRHDYRINPLATRYLTHRLCATSVCPKQGAVLFVARRNDGTQRLHRRAMAQSAGLVAHMHDEPVLVQMFMQISMQYLYRYLCKCLCKCPCRCRCRFVYRCRCRCLHRCLCGCLHKRHSYI